MKANIFVAQIKHRKDHLNLHEDAMITHDELYMLQFHPGLINFHDCYERKKFYQRTCIFTLHAH